PIWRLLHNHLKLFLGESLQHARFNGFNAVQARLVGSETFYRRNTVAFEEKLSSNFFTITIYPSAQASFFNEVHFSRDLTFLQKDLPGRHFFFFKIRAK